MEEVKELSDKLVIANKDIGDMTSNLEIANKEIDTQKATITGLETKVKEFEQKEVDALKVKRDEQWEEIKNKLPPGLTHKNEDEAALRGEFDTDPYTFSTKYVGIQNKEGRGEYGAEFVPGDPDSQEAEDMKVCERMAL